MYYIWWHCILHNKIYKIIMQAKALYNLLRYNWLSDSSLKVEQWQVENLRELRTEELFSRLEKQEIPLDEEKFLKFAETVNTPEELVECLWIQEHQNLSEFDQAYLLLFELWRRLLPDKQSISVFCDELDHRIALHDTDALASEQLLLESLEELEDILDENVDRGEDPQEVFDVITTYCAHDLESFLYDYIVEQIEAGNDVCASELLEGFYEYVSDQRWFQFLRIALFASEESSEAELMLRRLLDQMQEEPDFDLLLEIANFLVHRGDVSLFIQSIQQICPLLETEGQFQELLATVAKFYQYCDKDAQYLVFSGLAAKRSEKDPKAPLDKNDPDFSAFKQHLCD